MVAHTLILLRHAKSDWSGSHADRDRPIGDRGRRQASEAGRWLAAYAGDVGLVVLSPAARVQSTWELVRAELADVPPARVDERMYAFGEEQVLDVVRSLSPSVGAALLVGHNPALEELVERLTRTWAHLPTSSLAVLDLPGEWSSAGDGAGSVRAVGRPPTAPGDPG